MNNKFRLLGVDFDSDLAEMDNNFRNRVDEIRKLFQSWLYRHLTAFDKIAILKSIVLSKLSHVFVVPKIIWDPGDPSLGQEVIPSSLEEGECYEVSQGEGREDPAFVEEAPPTDS